MTDSPSKHKRQNHRLIKNGEEALRLFPSPLLSLMAAVLSWYTLIPLLASDADTARRLSQFSKKNTQNPKPFLCSIDLS